MKATWRPLLAWPYPPKAKQADRFDSTWSATLDKLEREIERIDGRDVVIGVVCDDSQISLSGHLRASAKVRHPGVEVSFDVPAGPVGWRRVVFHTDAYGHLSSNLRAIALGLEALRAVDRYGITSTGEQYTGFQALSSGGPDPERGRRLVEAAGAISAALKRHHPDHGGDARDFADVQAYRQREAG